MKRPDISELRIARDASPKAWQGRVVRRWVWPLLLLLGGGALLAAWWGRPAPVRTVAVTATAVAQQLALLNARGHVVAQVRAAVAAKGTGRLVELLVREGSVVRRGDLLARLDPSDADAALRSSLAAVTQARARLHQAELSQTLAQGELTRLQGLQASGFVSEQAVETQRGRARTAEAGVDAVRAEVEMARAQREASQVNLRDTEIRAPFDGVVLVRSANVGEVITPLSSAVGAQSAVVTLADLRTLEVEADVSESELSKVRTGQAVEIALDALPDDRFPGRVDAIVPTVDRASATVRVKIRFDAIDPRVLPEMSAKLSFLSRAITPADQRPVLTVPVGALRRTDGAAQVLRLRQDAGVARVEVLDVRAGREAGGVVELGATAGAGAALQAGDTLVLDPSPGLRAGDPVAPQAR